MTNKNEVNQIPSKKNYINYNDSNPMFYKSTKFDFYDGYNNALYNHFHIGGFPKILSKFDRLSMAYGVEVRSPFLDHRCYFFIFLCLPNIKSETSEQKNLEETL